ncbi:hypothetical protein BT96DRAFT_1019474 [Gymnopus androsaceus JB14]|uniref:DUF6534 domain-containing protein n=1 Tax=Gymnopus androsaceus JB14 TaxID=1447944 RepID=A0A6A4HKN4_9AGAR|nr:hypothetical protein BT96DRAFT_1019474 [Gymnopus androsaceus JB14]
MSSFLISLDSVFDGMFYGFVVSTVLFGVTMVQAWIYIRRNRDSWLLRSLVAFLVSLDFTATFLNAQTVHDLLLVNFGNVEELLQTPVTLKAEILISFVVIFVVNVFFAYRIYLLRQIHISVAFFIAAIGTAAFVIGLLASASIVRANATLINDAKFKKYMMISLAISVVSDILSTIAISWSLYKMRTGFKRTDSLVQKFFHFIVGRGLLLALDQISTLIVLSVQNEYNWIPSHFILTRLYVITIVAMLNSRPGIKDDVGSVATNDTSSSESFMLDNCQFGPTQTPGRNQTATTVSEVPTITAEEANRRFLHYYPTPEEKQASTGSFRPEMLYGSR